MTAGITTCPQCRTRFRVSEAHLAARGGDVRCGRCSHVFNAYAFLQEETQAEDVPSAEPREEPPPPPPAESIPEVEPEAPPVTETVEQTASAEEETAPPAPLDDTAEEAQPEIRVVRVPTPVSEIQPKATPDRPKYAPPPKPKKTWPWVLASLLLLFLLATQAIYHFRDHIAANYPPTRPLLERACAYLRCEIRLPQNADLLGIETSELHADPARANIVVLTSVLRNRAPHVQAYPMLELTLTNVQDEMVARRTFTPKEYVRQPAGIEQGIPAKGEVAVKLLLDLGSLRAEGYRLYLYYP